MEPRLGRFLDAFPLPRRRFLRVVIDLGLGLDADVQVEGRQLVFRVGSGGRGFLRVTSVTHGLRLGFPRGGELFDPAGRLSGPIGLEQSILVHHPSEVDPYLRRLIEEARRLEDR